MSGYQKYTPAQRKAWGKKMAAAKAAKSYGMSPRRPRTSNRRYVQGRGDYKVPRNFFSAPKTGEAVGSILGGWVAPGIGSAIGGTAGRYLGQQFKSITGWGDYAVKQNSLVQPDYLPPSFGEDTIRVKKREMIIAIDSVATGSFQPTTFSINPGLSESFPWASALASNYEQYFIHGLIFQFVSTSSDAIASTTNLGLGQVIMATDYNGASADFQDGPQMLGSMFSNSGKPSDCIMHALECAPSQQSKKLYFLRSGAVPSNASILDYDYGKFTIALDNMPAAYQGVGQLWVTYDISFVKSVQNNQLGWNLQTDFWNDLAAYSPTNANPFGTALSSTSIVGNAGSNLGCSLDNTNIYFPDNLASGYYQVTIQWTGTAAAITAPSMTRSGCELVNCFYSTNQSVSGSPANAVSSIHYLMTIVVKLTGNYATGNNYAKITFASAILPSSITHAFVMINQVNGDIFDGYATTA